ncbi:MAG: single-stranded DNA-binding protein [Bacteroidales bacterium]|nr:single-stranded DNA-binding protein [Bacteroidales bacterium]
MSVNKVILVGNVGKDPEVRYLEGTNANGQQAKIARFPLATSERFRDRSGETRENTEWHNIVAWRNSADVAERFIRKGTQIYVEGRIRTRQWTDQTGVKKYQTEIEADTIQLLGRREDGPQAADAPAQPAYQPQPAYQQPAPQQPAPAAEAPINIMGDGSDDLPF